MTEIVAHWGAHDAGGVWFLEQAEGGSNALGLSLGSPFQVRPVGKAACNHAIKLTAPSRQPPCDDVLIRQMAPIPKRDGQVAYFVDNGRVLPAVSILARLSSPIAGIVRPYWTKRQSEWVKELETTNVQPLVLTGIEPKHTHSIVALVQAAAFMPRRLVLVGRPIAKAPLLARVAFDPPDYPPDLPWEEIGADLLGRWMRGDHAP